MSHDPQFTIANVADYALDHFERDVDADSLFIAVEIREIRWIETGWLVTFHRIRNSRYSGDHETRVAFITEVVSGDLQLHCKWSMIAS